MADKQGELGLVGRRVRDRAAPPAGPLTSAGLFAGIGGFELGLARAGHRTALLCEIWEPAQAVLRARDAETSCVN